MIGRASVEVQMPRWSVFRAAATVAVLLASGPVTASAETIYHEIFSSGGATRSLPFDGWKANQGAAGATWTSPNFAAPNGSTEMGSVNSNPSYAAGAAGYLYAPCSANNASFLWTDEFIFSLKTYKHLKFSARTNDSNTEYVRAAIKVGSTWYVSAPVTTTYGGVWSDASKWIVNADTTTWYILNFTPGSTMSVGSAVTFPSEGVVYGFGIFANAQGFNRNLRFDNFKVEGTRLTLSLASTQRIWSQAPSNSFTDIHGYAGNLYCVLREGTTHTASDGKIRVLRYNPSTLVWDSIKLLSYTPPAPYTAGDLRDPKLSTRPSDGKLMLTVAATLWTGSTKNGTQSMSYFSTDGINWGTPNIIGAPGSGWLWRTEWSGGTAYNFKYGGDAIRLFESADGTAFTTQVGPTYFSGLGREVNETALTFDGTRMVALARCEDATLFGAMLGSGNPPYSSITWYDTHCKIGGPDLFRMENGQIILGARRYAGNVASGDRYTAILLVQEDLHSISKELLRLPPTTGDAGDCGYPGIWKYGSQLWVSYYSSHELGKPCVYIAKINYTLP